MRSVEFCVVLLYHQNNKQCMWKNKLIAIKNFLIETLFPKSCIGCQKEGFWLCEDCIFTLEIQNWCLCPICQKRVLNFKTCPNCKSKTKLNGLFIPLSYENLLVKKTIRLFKYEPFLKELYLPLSYIIISHLNLIECNIFDDKFVIIPVPLYKSRLKWRGYNQAELIAKELSSVLRISFDKNNLIKIKNTPPQAELIQEDRFKNVTNVFLCQNPENIKNKKVLLIDDIYTTGTTMEECAKILKQSGAKEVWGLVVARG